MCSSRFSPSARATRPIFLTEQDMTRFDAVNFISHGISKRAGMSEPRGVRGVEDDFHDRRGRGQQEAQHRRARSLLRQPEPEGEGRADRSADRPRQGDRAHHPGALPPVQEQPALCRRSGRRQDRDCRGARAQDRARRGAAGARQRDGVRARHGHAPGRHALPRRLRGAAEGGHEGDRGLSRRDPVHRRDPHGDRRGRDLGRRDGRLEPAEAGAAIRRAALHRLDHLQGIPPALREGPRARPPLPEDRRGRADRGRRHRDPEGPEALFRGLPQHQIHEPGHQGGGRAFGEIHPRPQAARQGHRRDRRGRRLADAAAASRSASAPSA